MTLVFDDSNLSTYSYSQLVHLNVTLPCQPEHSRITLLSQRYVSKAFRDDKAEDAIKALDFASSLDIRVPRIRRIVHVRDVVYCEMVFLTPTVVYGSLTGTVLASVPSHLSTLACITFLAQPGVHWQLGDGNCSPSLQVDFMVQELVG